MIRLPTGLFVVMLSSAISYQPDSHTQVSKDYGVYNPNQIDYVFHIYEQTFAQDKFSSSKLSLEAFGLTFVVGRFALTATTMRNRNVVSQFEGVMLLNAEKI